MAIVARKGGVGKSTLAVLLGRAYARSGARVCLVDLDPQATASRVLAEPATDGGQALGERLLEGQAMDPLLIPTVVEGVQIVPSGDALSIHETRIASDQFGVRVLGLPVFVAWVARAGARPLSASRGCFRPGPRHGRRPACR